ncbi:beta-ketoacyl synthase chain length factor [Desulforhopalus vacuolatus]|uniref:beta-ketoacyl synthase chain length factor n=1 Tax=Desulforhopalus vacuolatus TaxID=40414 RepID=UPI001964DA9A|nr:beta-ketoacyl synthase chain length factor [Desulforhopalus vacuolatus]MBM9519744.1 beta-ketoacyl synthase chain length factor [Desulforhopalus vacuolatus]
MTVFISKIYAGLLSDIEIPSQLARHLRRADDFIRLGVAAAHNVLGDEMLQTSEEKCSCGIFLSTFTGPMNTNIDVLKEIVHLNPLSPTLFSHSVANSAVGYMANIFNIQGCTMSCTEFEFPFFRALEQGMCTIESGLVSSCLVLQVETYSNLLKDVRQKQYPESDEWQPGVACWFLTNNETTAQFSIDSLTIENTDTNDCNYLSCEEHVTLNQEKWSHQDPLKTARLLSENLSKNKKSPMVCVSRAAHSTVRLEISPSCSWQL